jgi:hypothetical protein
MYKIFCTLCRPVLGSRRCEKLSSSVAKQPILSHSLPWEILPDLYHPLFTSLNFATTYFFFTEQCHQPCVKLPTWRTRSLYVCTSSDRVAQLYPQAPGSPFVAFCGSQSYGEGILARLHTGGESLYWKKFDKTLFLSQENVYRRFGRECFHMINLYH